MTEPQTYVAAYGLMALMAALLIGAGMLWDGTHVRRDLLKACNDHRYELRYWATLPVTARPALAAACLQPDIQGRLDP